ncbi:MAG: hypothetical protein RIR74_397 [Pseudomonadota bacterium]
MSLALRLGLLVVVLSAAVFLALLAMASGQESRLDDWYAWLVGMNLVLSAAMATLVVLVLARTWRRHRQRVFGSRLMIRLALAFAPMGIVPVGLVAVVSSQFLAKTIDSWFSQSVDGGLESGAALGRATLEAIQVEAMTQARRLALALEAQPDDALSEAVETLTDGRDGLEVLVLNAKGRVLAIRSASLFRLVPDMPSAEALNRARAARQFVIIEPRPEGPPWGLQVRALAMSVPATLGADQIRFVQWLEPVPEPLARNIDALNKGYSDYRQLALGKEGISRIYGVTLTLTLLLAIFAALLAAALLSAWLAGPLRALERATKAVAEGDYPKLRDDAAKHELGDLIRSFNEMTRQLQEARDLAMANQRDREAAAFFLEQVLSHLSAGVLVFDGRWQLVRFNPGAVRILGAGLSERMGESLSALPLLKSQADTIMAALAESAEDQRQMEVSRSDGQLVTLLTSTSRLPSQDPDQSDQFVLVFDDISDLMSAQRAKTWSDMARRLAHEIKNPLTPIQLSAERLQRRLLEKLSPEDKEVLDKSCDTIVTQVAGLKAMVDEFRDYARLPMARPTPLHLGQLLREIMPLYAADARVVCEPDPAPATIMADQAQMRQVLHNLVQNAQDAVGDAPDARVVIHTGWVDTPDGPRAVIRVDDNGPGIPAALAGRLFEPYVTTKPKGSGLGLAIVKKIAEENRATISLETRRDEHDEPIGTRAQLQFADPAIQAENQTHG